MWRHGDVMIASVEAIPRSAHAVPGAVLARGEATGHAHRIAKPDSVRMWRSGATSFLEVLKPAQLVHEEHATIELPPGTYRFWMQREYSPEAIRRVVD
jgi:hypothetical protein